MADSDDIFKGMDGDFDAEKIALEEAAKVLVGLFKSFTAQGLTPPEAAALTAAIMAQGFPIPPTGPSEGS